MLNLIILSLTVLYIMFLVHWYNQAIWDEVGESENERDKMLLDIEQECVEVYRRKVDQASRCRAQLRQAIADSEAEIAAVYSAMGERQVQTWQVDGSSFSTNISKTGISYVLLVNFPKHVCVFQGFRLNESSEV